MNTQLASLITQQEAKVESLKKRIAELDQERNATVADILMAQGKLEGLQAAAALVAPTSIPEKETP